MQGIFFSFFTEKFQNLGTILLNASLKKSQAFCCLKLCRRDSNIRDFLNFPGSRMLGTPYHADPWMSVSSKKTPGEVIIINLKSAEIKLIVRKILYLI